MSTSSATRWLVATAAIVAAVVVTLLLARPDAPARAAGSAQTRGSTPDYGDPSAWAAHPQRRDPADAQPDGRIAPAGPARDAAVFFVATATRSPITPDAADSAAARAERRALRHRANVFAACCEVYAPRYRSGAQAAADLQRAFAAFLDRRPEGPLLLAGDADGTRHLASLLVERVAGTPRRERLVAAWLVDHPVARDAFERAAPDLPVCADPLQVRCVLGWWSRTGLTGEEALRASTDDPLCVDPLTGLTGDAIAPAVLNRGALPTTSDSGPLPSLRPGVAGARCLDGVLWPIFPRPGDAGEYARADGSPDGYALFWANVRADAVRRLASWRRGSGAPAGALPQ